MSNELQTGHAERAREYQQRLEEVRRLELFDEMAAALRNARYIMVESQETHHLPHVYREEAERIEALLSRIKESQP